MARKVKVKLYPGRMIREQPPFPQTPLHKLVYSWLNTFKRDGDLWNVLSALRGCDVINDNTSKHYTTMRLRAVLGLNSSILGNDQGKIPASNERPLIRREQLARNKSLAKTPLHFQQHWNLAIKSVRYATGYDLDTETKVPKDKD